MNSYIMHVYVYVPVSYIHTVFVYETHARIIGLTRLTCIPYKLIGYVCIYVCMYVCTYVSMTSNIPGLHTISVHPAYLKALP